MLAAEFVGVFAPETVERCVRASYRQLADQATVATYLPLLAQRFARKRLHTVSRSESLAADRPGVLFVCSHNSGRSQIAAGWLAHLAPENDAWPAGTEPSGEVSAVIVEAMREVGSVDSVRSARDEIRERVEPLIGSLRTVAR